MAELRFGGGLNQLSDELISFDECTEGENFLLDADSRDFKRRPSFDLKGTATNAKSISGILQLIKRDDTETTLIQANETVYQWDGASSFTSRATVTTNSLLRGSYWGLDDILVITDLNKSTVVKTWNGTAVATLSHNIAGVTNLYAKYALTFQNRVWLFNVKTDSNENQHVILAGAFESASNFNNANNPTSTSLTQNVAFYLTTPNLKAINGVARFFDTILISTVEGQLFYITGSDASDYRVDEFYSGSSAAGNELICNIGNDVMFVRPGGKVEKLRGTQDFGDTKADDVSKFIPDETSGITSGIMVYDRVNQRIPIFLSSKILVVDKYVMEKGETSPWMKWTTGLTAAQAVNAAAFIRRPGATTYSVYFGGSSGQVYDLNGTAAGDHGSTLINTYRKSKLIDNLDTTNEFVSGTISYRRKGAFTAQLTFEWTDEYTDTISRVPLKTTVTSVGTDFWGSQENPIYWGGSNYWNEGGIAQERVSTANFDAVGKGPSFFFTLSCNTTVDFLIHKIVTPQGLT